MAVYIANFGRENYAWQDCLERSTIATMNRVKVHPFWESGDREGYIDFAKKHIFTARNERPTTPVASRWFNLMTIISESLGDYWIHRDKDDIWWTKTTSEPAIYEEINEPIGDREKVIICHKPCLPWSNKDMEGRPLKWNALHMKARDFMATEATLQKMNSDNAEYALALLHGQSLEPWHSRSIWEEKQKNSSAKASSGKIFSPWEIAVARIAITAFNTTKTADGSIVQQRKKNKDMMFNGLQELEDYIKGLAVAQDYHCALTGLPFNRQDNEGDPELNISLDRIDSNGHYEKGNLQIVCKFANRWKSDDSNELFLNLIEKVRQAI